MNYENFNKRISKSYDEGEEDTTKYGEFISSYFAWVSLPRQKDRVQELENMTKKKNKIQELEDVTIEKNKMQKLENIIKKEDKER